MEINIKKKKKPVWPWILALLVILAIIFVLYTQFGDEVEQQINNNNETSYVAPQNDVQMDIDVDNISEDIAYYDEVKEFINYVELNNNLEAQQNYTETATVYLAHALSRIVDLEHVGDSKIEAKRDELMRIISTLTKDDSANEDPNLISLAFNNAADLMAAMQKKDYPDLQPQIQNVEKVAKSIQSDQLSAVLPASIKEFFLVSKVALQAISEIDTL